MFNNLKKLAVAAFGFLAVTSANAAVDTTAITTGITEAQTAVATIGAAVVLVVVGIKVYKWIQRSL